MPLCQSYNDSRYSSDMMMIVTDGSMKRRDHREVLSIMTCGRVHVEVYDDVKYSDETKLLQKLLDLGF